MRLPTWDFVWREGGQSLVLVALSFSLLCAGGAMGIDIGRFYAERRFLQDAVDSAALACARSFAISSSSATAWSAADDILQNRLLNKNPLGLTVTYAARGSETYDDNIVADVRSGQHFMGESFTTQAPPVFSVRLMGTNDFQNVVVVKDGTVVYSTSGNRVMSFSYQDTAAQKGKTSYYYVRGQQTDGQVVWVSPMWVTLQ